MPLEGVHIIKAVIFTVLFTVHEILLPKEGSHFQHQEDAMGASTGKHKMRNVLVKFNLSLKYKSKTSKTSRV